MTFRTYSDGAKARDQAGFMLIEVMITALMVALIAIATLSGFDAAGKATADERFHDQAAILASESQEALRSDPASTLDQLENSPHSYKVTLEHEEYTITQTASVITDSTQHAGCSATGSESSARETDNYLEVKSSVEWPQLVAAKRVPVTQASIITPPDGSTLEVDVTSGGTAPAPVPGVTVLAEGVKTTTGAAGCVVYGSIPSTTVNIEAFKENYVTETGAYKVSAEEFTIAPNITTHYPVTLAEGGRITANFLHNNEPATGDTFVVGNSEMKSSSQFEVGSTVGTLGTGGLYEVSTGTYSASATSPVNTPHFANGNLFPFKQKWNVYAGDCPENSPLKVTKGAVKEGEEVVTAGGLTTVNVPTSFVELNLYAGKSTTKPEKLETKSYPATITNVKCLTTVTPANETKITNTHKQSTSTSGHLEDPYQPFGKFKLCVYSSSKAYSDEVEYENLAATGAKLKLYIGEEKSYETETEKIKYKITVKSGNQC